MAFDKHYTGRQAADLLGIDYETVLHLAQAGEIASIRVGRLRRFPESGLHDFARRHNSQNVIPLYRSRVAAQTNEEATHVDP